MRIPVEKLTKNDYLLLEYISNFERVSKDQIEKHFNGKIASVSYRLSELTKMEVYHDTNSYVPRVIPNSSYIIEDIEQGKHVGVFRISELGRATLDNYKVAKRHNKKQLLLKNAWLPIVVTLLTNLIIDGVKWLLPLIQQWLSNVQK